MGYSTSMRYRMRYGVIIWKMTVSIWQFRISIWDILSPCRLAVVTVRGGRGAGGGGVDVDVAFVVTAPRYRYSCRAQLWDLLFRFKLIYGYEVRDTLTG
jgi:hypothetical protein